MGEVTQYLLHKYVEEDILLSKALAKSCNSQSPEILVPQNFLKSEIQTRRLITCEMRDSIIAILCDYRRWIEPSCLKCYIQIYITHFTLGVQRDSPGRRLEHIFTGERIKDTNGGSHSWEAVPSEIHVIVRKLLMAAVHNSARALINRVLGPVICECLTSLKSNSIGIQKPPPDTVTNSQVGTSVHSRSVLWDKAVTDASIELPVKTYSESELNQFQRRNEGIAAAILALVQELKIEFEQYSPQFLGVFPKKDYHFSIIYMEARRQVFYLISCIPYSSLWPTDMGMAPGIGEVLQALQQLQDIPRLLNVEIISYNKEFQACSDTYAADLLMQAVIAQHLNAGKIPPIQELCTIYKRRHHPRRVLVSTFPHLLTPLAHSTCVGLHNTFGDLQRLVWSKMKTAKVWEPGLPPKVLYSNDVVDVWTFINDVVNALSGTKVPWCIAMSTVLHFVRCWLLAYVRNMTRGALLPGYTPHNMEYSEIESIAFPLRCNSRAIFRYLISIISGDSSEDYKGAGKKIDARLVQSQGFTTRKKPDNDDEDQLLSYLHRRWDFLANVQVPEYSVRLWDLSFSLKQLQSLKKRLLGLLDLSKEVLDHFESVEKNAIACSDGYSLLYQQPTYNTAPEPIVQIPANLTNRTELSVAKQLLDEITDLSVCHLHTGEKISKFIATRTTFYDLYTDLFKTLYTPTLTDNPLKHISDIIRRDGIASFYQDSPPVFYAVLSTSFLNGYISAYVFVLIDKISKAQYINDEIKNILREDEISLKKLVRKMIEPSSDKEIPRDPALEASVVSSLKDLSTIISVIIESPFQQIKKLVNKAMYAPEKLQKEPEKLANHFMNRVLVEATAITNVSVSKMTSNIVQIKKD